jgi:tetratricopeptide (TPR) repeat protein
MLRQAHNHRLQIALQRGDDPGFARETKAYFEQAAKAQAVTKQRIENTPSVDHERELYPQLRQLIEEEVQVRSLVAEHHFARREFADALVHLNRALEADPRRFAEYYNRGRVLLELGRLEDAKADFRRFLADPSVPATSDKAVFALKAIDR